MRPLTEVPASPAAVRPLIRSSPAGRIAAHASIDRRGGFDAPRAEPVVVVKRIRTLLAHALSCRYPLATVTHRTRRLRCEREGE